MDLGFNGKVALVAASSGGLGYATALQLATEGSKVMLTSRSEERLASAAEKIISQSGNTNVAYQVADVSSKDDIGRLCDTVEKTYGGVDILITNAGGPPPGNFESVQEQDWELGFQLSLMSVVRLVQGALPHMKQQRFGRIVHFTSSSIKQPIDNLILSNTFRTAIAGLGKSLAIELAPFNILVNTLGPGRIATDRVAYLDRTAAERQGLDLAEVIRRSEGNIPLGRYGDPEEFASIAAFLASPRNGYVTGQSILVDGGMIRSL
ncbi:SDR family oxidoreductase [Alicyclobacillus ferrooxydans]|uniref:3-oxoacyl-ACP reductase n=1 Tax=Alicyclobacillus ferrooxydans TaxID=471514 RepID=A0A0P9CK93_9BACL|nr:SDR family oxidoreductase [Alicyclobacillus ferrooxydans]KPV39347.1 3-oxoacyl-ACP reductase [Alicyclobacillus ferrooxydans]